MKMKAERFHSSPGPDEIQGFQQLLLAILEVADRVYTRGIAEASLPAGDEGCPLFRAGIDLLANGLDADRTLEILTTLLRSSGPDFGRLPANVAAVEAVRGIVLGERASEVRRRAKRAVGQDEFEEEPSPHLAPAPQPGGTGPLILRGGMKPGDAPLNTTRDVMILGNVPDGGAIKTSGSLTVSGQVGAAELEAGGDLSVGGCVHGKGTGKLLCGGDLRARSLERVKVIVSGDVRVTSGIVHATVRCGGNLFCEGQAGAVFGGSLAAEGFITATRIGAPYCDWTKVRAGAAVTATESVFSGVHVEIGSAFLATRSNYERATFVAEGASIVVRRSESDHERRMV
jgi:hypothetical protein